MEQSRAEPAPAGDPSAEAVAAVREASAAARLTTLAELKEWFPDSDPAALIAGSGAEDLKLIEGKRAVYYFSESSMTRAYALLLFRIAEKDLVKLVADTVRDESRIYPRPTDARIFSEEPFSLRESAVQEILGRLELHPEGADIRTCRASNGALYLFSTAYLDPNLAQSLAEWIEVGQKENP